MAELLEVPSQVEGVYGPLRVECVNGHVRLVQVARKRLGEDFVYLLAVHHNLHAFGRGGLREGKSPVELAGIKLPTNDWIELLDLAAAEAPAAGSSPAALASPLPPPAAGRAPA